MFLSDIHLNDLFLSFPCTAARPGPKRHFKRTTKNLLPSGAFYSLNSLLFVECIINEASLLLFYLLLLFCFESIILDFLLLLI